MSAFQVGQKVVCVRADSDVTGLVLPGQTVLVDWSGQECFSAQGRYGVFWTGAFEPIDPPPPTTIPAIDLTDDLATILAEQIGRPVTSGLRCLLLGRLLMHAGKIIEGPEQL